MHKPGLKNAEGTVLLLPQRAQLVVRRERTLRTRHGSNCASITLCSGSGPSRKRQATSDKRKKYLTGYVIYGIILHNLKKGKLWIT